MPQGSVISPALFNHFVSDCPVGDLDMASYADDFTFMTSSSSVEEAVEEANRMMEMVVGWASRKELSIAPHKSSVTLFTPDTHQSNYHPLVEIEGAVVPLVKTPKILGLTWDTHYTFGPHASATTQRATSTLRVLKALAGTSWGFSKETLVGTYKAITRPILNYAAPIWQPSIKSSHLDKMEVVQNSALRIATGNTLMSAIHHLQAETEVLPLRSHLELCATQYLASALQTCHPSHSLVTKPPGARHMQDTLQSKHLRALRPILGPLADGTPPVLFGGVVQQGRYPEARRRLRAEKVRLTLNTREVNRVLLAPPPKVDPAETMLPRAFRSALSQLR